MSGSVGQPSFSLVLLMLCVTLFITWTTCFLLNSLKYNNIWKDANFLYIKSSDNVITDLAYFTSQSLSGNVQKAPNLILCLPQNCLRSKMWRILLLILMSGDIGLNPGPAEIRNLSIGSWNINSLPKDSWHPVDELQNGLLKNIDILSLQETKLDSSITNTSLKINGY